MPMRPPSEARFSSTSDPNFSGVAMGKFPRPSLSSAITSNGDFIRTVAPESQKRSVPTYSGSCCVTKAMPPRLQRPSSNRLDCVARPMLSAGSKHGGRQTCVPNSEVSAPGCPRASIVGANPGLPAVRSQSAERRASSCLSVPSRAQRRTVHEPMVLTLGSIAMSPPSYLGPPAAR